MTNDNDQKGSVPAKLSATPLTATPLTAKPLQAQPVTATPFDTGAEIPSEAGVIQIFATGAAVRVAKNMTEIRILQSDAASAIARTTGSLKTAQANLIEMKEMMEEAEIRQIERQRRKKQALNDSFLDDQHRNIENAAAAIKANQVLRNAETSATFQQLSNEAQIQEKRIELMRLTAQEEVLRREMQIAQLPPPPPPGPDPTEAKVRYIVKDAAEDLVKTGPEFLYHAYAGCHYLAARMRGLSHEAAVKDTYDLVLERVRMHPLRLEDSMEYQRRYETLKGVMRAKQAADKSAAAERERAQAQIEVERLRKEVEEHRLRAAQAMSSAFGYIDYDTEP